MAQTVTVTGLGASLSADWIGNFLKYIRDTSNQIITDTSGDGIREPDAPIFTATGLTAAQALSVTGPT